MPDLTRSATRDQVSQVVADTYTGVSDSTAANYSGQLWALRGRIAVGDLMVMPMKTTKQIALGRVTGTYQYRATDGDLNKRHVVPVDWQRVDLPRSAVKQDLLFTLGSAMSVFSPSKNNAVTRLESLMNNGVDPGHAVALSPRIKLKPATPMDDIEDVDEPELSPDIEVAALDQITSKIKEEFTGHGLATLVSALLAVEGLHCEQSPPGPDGGIDIVAGRGLLGLDDLIVVQVKSGGQVGSPIVKELHGNMATHGAEQGLLVAWDGLSKPARDALKANNMRVRVWQDTDVVEAVLANYEKLDSDIRAQLPLKRVWILTDGRN